MNQNMNNGSNQMNFDPNTGQPINQGMNQNMNNGMNQNMNNAQYTPEEAQNGKTMAILSYIGFLSLIAYFGNDRKTNRFVNYHATQGINIFLISIIGGVVSGFIPIIGALIASALSLFIMVISIMGIVDACNGNAKELPLISKIKLIK